MPAKKRQSLDSGLAESSSAVTDSNAIKDFFDSYMPKFELAIRENFQEEDFDDPTIDLNTINRQKENVPSPIKRSNQKRTVRPPAETRTDIPATQSKKRDPSFEELEFLNGVFESRKDYGNKLANIMLKGLEKTLTPEIYQIFLKDQIPTNWLPVIKMNNDNTPYVEFLVKSIVADEDPTTQMIGYTMDHVNYGQSIMMHLRERANMKSILDKPAASNSNNETYVHIPAEHRCSTPVKSPQPTAVKRRVSKPARPPQNLNDSKRILPSRNCKVLVPNMYRPNV